jgi:predicted ABC-type ATPase
VPPHGQPGARQTGHQADCHQQTECGQDDVCQHYLPNEAGCPVFVNADLIAEGLSPFQPGSMAVRAGRLMLGRFMNMREKENVSLLKRH